MRLTELGEIRIIICGIGGQCEKENHSRINQDSISIGICFNDRSRFLCKYVYVL
jgi:hypothetical protein